MSKRVAALPHDGGTALDKTRADEREEALLRRIAELEAELARTTGALQTQGAMLRSGVQVQAAKLARAREVQASTATEFTARLIAMEHEIARLSQELRVTQQKLQLPPWLKPVRRAGGAVWRRVSKWIPARSEPAQVPQSSAPAPAPKAKEPEEPKVKLLLKALPSQVAAWKALLGKRR